MLLDRIRALVAAGNYVVSEHASMRLEERGMLEWQVVDGIESGRLLAEHPQNQPHPLIEVKQVLRDGSPVKAVWVLVIDIANSIEFAKLVTVHFI